MTETTSSSQDTSAPQGRIFHNQREDSVAYDLNGQRIEIVLSKEEPTFIIASFIPGDEDETLQKIVLPRGAAALFTLPETQAILRDA